MEKIFIFSGRIARDLIQSKKYNLIDITVNQRDKKRTVFIFEKTEELIEYLAKRHNIEVE